MTPIKTEEIIELEPAVKKRPSKRRVITACVAAVAAAAITVVAIGAVLHNSHMKRQLDEMQQQLDSQSSTISEQQGALTSQSEALESQASEIKAKDETIKSQEGKIKEQQNKINALNSQLVAKRSTAGIKPTYTTVKPVNDGKKYVALTFDDGPGPYTAKLLDAMKARGVKATFYVVGSRVNSYKDIIRRIDAEGHAIGNHSNEHKNLTKLSATGVANEMNAAADKIKAIVGYEPTVMRCPGGSCNATVRNYAEGKGISITYWSVDTNDWRYQKDSYANAKNKIFANTFKSGSSGVRNGAIVLMHDIHKNSVDAAIEMMDRLIAEGYTLVTVPDLLLKREGGAIPGKVYS